MVTGDQQRRTALVTGAASGIGRAKLMTLRNRGLDAIGPELAPMPHDSRCVAADVSAVASVAAGLKSVIGMTGPLDVLENVAAFLREGPVAQLEAAAIDQIHAAHVPAVAIGCLHSTRRGSAATGAARRTIEARYRRTINFISTERGRI